MTALRGCCRERTEAAGHDDHEHVEGQQEGEHFRVDGGQEVAEQRPAHAREERAEAEGEHLGPEGVDAHDLRGDFVVADGLEDVAEVAAQELDHAVQGDEQPSVVDQQRGVEGDALDAEGGRW